MEIAIPGEYFFEKPARVKVMGTTDAVPKPTSEKPISAGQKYGKIIASRIPLIIIDPLRIYVAGIPILSMIRSEMNLDEAMNVMKIR